MAEYYVDKNHGSASDDNPGTEALPWLTIQKAATTAVAGDTVYVKFGTYNEWVEVQNSGSSGSPITFQAFDPENRPIIDATGIDIPDAGFDKAIIYSIGNEYLTIDGFIVRNSDEFLIRIRATNDASPIDGIIVKNCLCYNNVNPGNHDGIYFQYVDSGTIEGNEVYNTGWNAISLASCNNVDISFNYIHDNPLHAAINIFPHTTEDPQQLYSGNNIFFNVIYSLDNAGAAIYTRYQTDNVIIGNLIKSNNTGILFDEDRGASPYTHQSDTIVANNTIVDNADDGFRSINATHVTLINNIFAYNADFDVVFDTGTTTGSSTDHNLYFDSVKIKWGATTYTDVASYNVATGNEASGVEGDPEFVDRPNEDYSIDSSSSNPLDAGLWLTATNGTGTDSNTMVVDNAELFLVGFSIQLDGQTTTSEITDINYGTNTLTLETALTWADGVGIYYPFYGTDPDIGYWQAVQAPPLPVNGTVWNEAEAFTLVAPMVIGNDAEASGGQYISSPTDESGTGALSFYITVPGYYKILTNVNAGGSSADSFHVTVDSEDEFIWDCLIDYGIWGELEVSKRGTGTFNDPEFNPYTVYLAAGNHTVTFRCRDSNTLLDKVKFQFIPEVGTGTTSEAQRAQQNYSLQNRDKTEIHEFLMTASDAGGAFTSKASDEAINGWITKVVTNPGVIAPTDNYDLTLTDSDGVDIMGGALSNRDSSASEQAMPLIGGAHGPVRVDSVLTIAGSNNSVNSASVTVKVYVRKE